MNPYYQRDGITLYHGDCIELDVPCDLLLVDPPYGQEFKSGKSELWGPIEGDRYHERRGISDRLTKAIGDLRRARHFYIFGGDWIDWGEMPVCGLTEIIWDKEMIGMGDLSLPWGPQHEKIIFGVYELSKANREKGYGKLAARLRKGSIVRSLRPNSGRVKHHPTEKPVDILRQLIESSSVMGETIYDPFAGSGSTLVAAALEGRAAIGCEFEERYCEIAARRLENECVEGRISHPPQMADKVDSKTDPARSDDQRDAVIADMKNRLRGAGMLGADEL